MRNFIVGILVTIGLGLAGSDGPYFPWPNLGGAALFVAAITMLHWREA